MVTDRELGGGMPASSTVYKTWQPWSSSSSSFRPLAHLVEDGRAFVCRAQLHLLVRETDVTTLVTLLLRLRDSVSTRLSLGYMCSPAVLLAHASGVLAGRRSPRAKSRQDWAGQGIRTIGSRPLAASSAFIVFCTSARLALSAEGNALGDEYVLVGRFSYAVVYSVSFLVPADLGRGLRLDPCNDIQLAGSLRPHWWQSISSWSSRGKSRSVPHAGQKRSAPMRLAFEVVATAEGMVARVVDATNKRQELGLCVVHQTKS